MSRHSLAGVTLIEVLIAAALFSVGSLGLVRMHIAALQNVHEASQRSVATALGRDLIARMRSNPGQLAIYESITLESPLVVPEVDCRAQACSAPEIARSDIYAWSAMVLGFQAYQPGPDAPIPRGGLVVPRACITAQKGQVSVALAWRGLSRMENPAHSPCGESIDLYGPDNERRRLLVFNTFIGGAERG